MTDNSILMALAEADRLRYQQQQDETFKRWAAEKSRQMDVNPIDSQPTPEGYSQPFYDKKRPQGKFGPLAMEPRAYRPGMVMDPQGMPDLEARLKGE